ncbi:cupin domain-containing protein [Massilia endophytica]|uniref:cupin domain-containing protein n=1 Tax=Massilia endophytica TaxID=2899220 RepID=UPI001E3C06BC|nr:cupin domain-containing protein [Massilia endophytica]UGQ46233.1 cupin domain-containing protein [Massilia endophytica]
MYLKKICIALAALPGLALAGAQSHPVFDRAIPNIPGKSLIAVEVNYAPGAKSAPHRHSKSAFIYAYVVSGAVRSQVEGQAARVYRAGEGFSELPGEHHLISENASESEPARLLAVFVVDSDDKPLSKPD